jgi:hypothetical protein
MPPSRRHGRSFCILAKKDDKSSEDKALAQALEGPLERLTVLVNSILTLSSDAGTS